MATTLDKLLKQFLRERKYLRNVSPQTIEWYETAWKAFRDSATPCLPDPESLNRAHLEQFVYALRLTASRCMFGACSPSHTRLIRRANSAALEPHEISHVVPAGGD